MGVSGHENTARPGLLFHSGGQIGCVAHRGVIHAKIISDGAYDHRPRVDTNPHFKFDTMFFLQFRSIAVERFLDGQ